MITPIRNAMIGIITGLMIMMGSLTIAAASPQTASAAGCQTETIQVLPPWWDGLCDSNGIMSPTKAPGGIQGFIVRIALNIVKLMLYIVGYVSIIFIIWGGFKFMISGDNASGVTAARKTILNAVIGLVLSIMSVAIVSAITGAIA